MCRGMQKGIELSCPLGRGRGGKKERGKVSLEAAVRKEEKKAKMRGLSREE